MECSEYECSLSSRQRTRFLDEDTRVWRIDDAALREIDNDLQTVVNCTRERDTLFFDVTRTVRPSSRVTIPWSLMVGTYTEDVSAVDGALAETEKKTVFTCPRENEGVFLAR